MTKKLVITLIFYVTSNSFAQIDTSVYYPLNTGNYWEYWGLLSFPTQWLKMTIESIGDTTFSNGKNYRILEQAYYWDSINPDLNYFYLRPSKTKIFEYTPHDSCAFDEFLLYDFILADSTIWTICLDYSANHRGVMGPYSFYSPTLNIEYEGKLFDWVEVNGEDTVWAPMGSPYVDRIAKGIGLIDRFAWDFADFYLFGAIINNQVYGTITGVSDDNLESFSFELEQNFPNPFNPVTTISYKLPTSGFVSMKVYDELGVEINTLVCEFKTAGTYKINFDGNELSSGVYFYVMVFNDKSFVRKMLLLK